MAGHVLLVEDDDEVAEVVSAILVEREVSVDRAASAAEGVAALADPWPPLVLALPDIVLIDYWLSGGDGGAVAAAATRRGVAFCFLTGDPAVADLLRLNGMPVLQKPFSMAALHAVTAAALPRRTVHDRFGVERLAAHDRPESRPDGAGAV